MTQTFPDELHSALEHLLAGHASQGDLAAIRRALADGQIAFAAGERSVAIGGNANYSIIITGDNNRLTLTAEALDRLIPPLAPRQAPALPQYFVPRPEYSDDLLARLLAPTTHLPGTLMVSAVHGLGGIGKTTLVAALAHDPHLRARFPDGVLWATLGQQPELLSLLSSWIRALGGYRYNPPSVDEAAKYIRTLLYEKTCLLVVDDAWNVEHIRPFLAGNERSPVIITTRDATLAQKVSAKLFDLDVMSKEQALALFEARLGKLNGEMEKALALAQELGCLPLALELAAAQVQDGQSWQKLLAAFRQGLADLEALSLDEATQRNESLRLCFKLSLEQLTETELEAFAWLGVLPEDVQINPQMAAKLWDVPTVEAGKRLGRFRRKALLKSVGEERYSVHDLLHDEAKLRLAECITLPQAHGLLLDRYGTQCKLKDGNEVYPYWHTLPNDDYIHAHLTWHMQQAGQIDAIHALLEEETPEGRNGWHLACEQQGQLEIYLADLNRAWNLAKRAGLDHAQLGRNLAHETLLALCHVSIVSQSNQYPPHLLSLAVKEKSLLPGHALTLAKQIPLNRHQAKRVIHMSVWGRAAALIALAPHLPADLLGQALAAAQAIEDERDRAQALTGLAPHLPADLLGQALAAAQAIKGAWGRAAVLTGLTPRLPPDVRTAVIGQALAAAQAIGDDRSRAKALTDLAPHLPPDVRTAVIGQALAAAQAIEDEWARAQALTSLAPHLPPGLRTAVIGQVLTAAQTIEDDSYQANALTALAPYLSSDLLGQALATARAIENDWDRAEALTAVAPHLPPGLRTAVICQALAAAQTIKDDRCQAKALIALAPYLSSDLLVQAVAAVKVTKEGWFRAIVLTALAPHLPPDLLGQALAAAQAIENVRDRAEALNGLAPHLPPDVRTAVIGQALAAARTIEDNEIRADALTGLAFHLHPDLSTAVIGQARSIEYEWDRVGALAGLDPDLLGQALAAAQAIEYESIRAMALTGLAPHLPPDLLGQALAAAQVIKYEGNRAKALTGLAPHLPPGLRTAVIGQALAAAQAIEDEWVRADALTALAPHLPPGLRTAVIGQALIAAQTIMPEMSNALACRLDDLAKDNPVDALDAWRASLQSAARWPRQQFLEGLGNILPFALAFLPPEQARPFACGVFQAIRSVARWWP